MKSLRILIVDDSAVMRHMLRRAVELTDVSVGSIFEAGNGREALALLETQEIDAMFTDINMPVMSGTELLHALQQQGRELPLRVVVSTDGSEARRCQARQLSVTRYVEKPLRPEVMRDVLYELDTMLTR